MKGKTILSPNGEDNLQVFHGMAFAEMIRGLVDPEKDIDKYISVSIILSQLTSLTHKVFLDVEDIQAMTTLSEGKVREMLASGEFPVTHMGTRKVMGCYDFAVWIYEQHQNKKGILGYDDE